MFIIWVKSVEIPQKKFGSQLNAINPFPNQQRGLMLRMRIIVLEIAANCVKFIRNAGKRVRAAVAQTGLSFIECSLFVSKRTAQNECKAGI